MFVRYGSVVGLFVSCAVALGACVGHPAPRPAPSAPPSSSSPLAGGPPTRALELGLLTRESAMAVQAGAGAMSLLGLDVAAEGDRVGAFVRLEREACVLLMARGTPSVDDVDLLVFEEDGATALTDEGADPRPGVVLCTEAPRRVYVVARVTAGRGWVALGAQRVPRGAVDAVAKATSARAHPAPASLEPFAALDVRARDARRDSGGAWEELRRVGLPVDASIGGHVSVTLDPGRCVHVLAVPSDETADLDVELRDGRGRVLGRAEPSGRDRVAVVCGSVSDELSATVRPRVGSGLAAIVLARTTGDTSLDVVRALARIDATPVVPARDAAARASRELSSLGLTRVGAGDAEAELGKRSRVKLTLPAGCSRVDVVAGAPLAGLRAEVWTAAGARLAAGEGGAGVTSHLCFAGGEVSLEVEALGRPGPVAWFAHHDPKALPQLAAPHGGALLDRLFAGRALAPREAREARVVSLREAERSTLDVTVPAGRCLRAAASVARGARGVELRALSRDEEVDVGRASEATAVRACAEPGRALPVSLVVTVGAGRDDGLVAWRFE